MIDKQMDYTSVYTAVLALLCSGVAHAKQVTQLKQIAVQVAPERGAVEHCSVQFLFNESPVITHIPERNESRISFLIPQSSCRAQFCDVARQLGGCGFVHVAQVVTPIQGVKITISYDPDRFVYRWQKSQSSTLEPLLVIRFFDKTVLDRLQNNQKPLLQLACSGAAVQITGKVNENSMEYSVSAAVHPFMRV